MVATIKVVAREGACFDLDPLREKPLAYRAGGIAFLTNLKCRSGNLSGATIR